MVGIQQIQFKIHKSRNKSYGDNYRSWILVSEYYWQRKICLFFLGFLKNWMNYRFGEIKVSLHFCVWVRMRHLLEWHWQIQSRYCVGKYWLLKMNLQSGRQVTSNLFLTLSPFISISDPSILILCYVLWKIQRSTKHNPFPQGGWGV